MLGMVKGTSLGEVAGAAAPFLLCDLILVLLLVAFPMLAMYLPNLMGI
jgi:TRAP-type C4-dicarboxylate transport system permease large subunit